MKIEWAPEAIVNLAGLRKFIAETNPTSANDIAKRILENVRMLEEFPHRGKSGRVPGTREITLTGTPFFIVYRVSSETLQIIAVLHSSLNWP